MTIVGYCKLEKRTDRDLLGVKDMVLVWFSLGQNDLQLIDRERFLFFVK